MKPEKFSPQEEDAIEKKIREQIQQTPKQDETVLTEALNRVTRSPLPTEQRMLRIQQEQLKQHKLEPENSEELHLSDYIDTVKKDIAYFEDEIKKLTAEYDTLVTALERKQMSAPETALIREKLQQIDDERQAFIREQRTSRTLLSQLQLRLTSLENKN